MGTSDGDGIGGAMLTGLGRPFRTNFRRNDSDSASERNRIGKLLAFARGMNGIRLWTSSGGGLVVDGQDLISYADIPFGYTIAGDQVTFNTGKIMRGERPPAIVYSTTRQITEDYQFVAVEYNFDSRTAQIGAPTTDEPRSARPWFRHWLFQFGWKELEGGTVKVWRRAVGWCGGNIPLPGTWA